MLQKIKEIGASRINKNEWCFEIIDNFKTSFKFCLV